MSEYSYEINAKITPESSAIGKKVHMEAALSGNFEGIRTVYASILQYDVSERFVNNGSGSFTLDYFIPWEAPSGNYRIEVYCIGNNGLREQKTYVNFQVL